MVSPVVSKISFDFRVVQIRIQAVYTVHLMDVSCLMKSVTVHSPFFGLHKWVICPVDSPPLRVGLLIPSSVGDRFLCVPCFLHICAYYMERLDCIWVQFFASDSAHFSCVISRGP